MYFYGFVKLLWASFDRIRVGSAAKHAASLANSKDDAAAVAAALMGDDIFAKPLGEVATLDDDMLEVLRKGEDDEFDNDTQQPENFVSKPSVTTVEQTVSATDSEFTDRGCRYPFPENNWADLTTRNFAARAQDPARAAASVAVLPVGAIEQHG